MTDTYRNKGSEKARFTPRSAELWVKWRPDMVKEPAFPACWFPFWEGFHLEELDPLLIALGAGVGHPQDPEFCSEEVGSIFLH